jgi:predicted small lipoprotein YifL
MKKFSIKAMLLLAFIVILTGCGVKDNLDLPEPSKEDMIYR